MFLIYVFTIWAAVLGHIFFRLQGLLGLRGKTRVLAGIALYLLGFLYVPARVMDAREIGESIAPVLEYTGALFMGFAAIFWTLLVAFEIAGAAIWLAARRRVRNASLPKRRALAAILCGAALFLCVMGFLQAQAAPAVTRLEVRAPGAEARRFVVISDVHLGSISPEGQWRKTLEAARRLQPDALLIPGDLIDDHSRRTMLQAAMVREFFPATRVYVTTGNHEYYAGIEEFEELCRRHGFRLLRQEVETLSPGLAIAGMDDRLTPAKRRAVEDIQKRTGGPLIFMTHRPANARLLQDRPLTLALAGHTHGGQIPPMVFLVTLGNGGFRSGYYKVGETDLYVSRGAGVWGPPMRLLAASEIVVIDVRGGQEFEVEVVPSPAENRSI